MLLLELKDDWLILDPGLSDFTGAELSRLDRMIKETFAEKLFSPGDITGPGETLNRAVREKGWPPLNDHRRTERDQSRNVQKNTVPGQQMKISDHGRNLI